MEVFNRFSLIEFLAYFFPGLLTITALFALLLVFPIKLWDQISVLVKEFGFWLFILAQCFIVGVLIAGITESLIRIRGKYNRRTKNKGSIHLKEFEKEIYAAFQQIFAIQDTQKDVLWSPSHTYVCRSLIAHSMPNAFEFAQRQNALRQLRMNIIPAILVWMVAGSAWGIKFVIIEPRLVFPGVITIFLSITISSIIVRNLIINMDANEVRETREIQSAFFAGYRTGIIKVTRSINEVSDT